MEDRKTLWIIFALGVMVLVVVGIGFFWFLPDDRATAGAGAANNNASLAGKSGFDPVEWVRKDEVFTDLEDNKDASEDFVVTSEELVYGMPENTGIEGTGTAEGTAADREITLELPQVVQDKQAVAARPVVSTPAAAAPVKAPEPKTTERQAVRTTEYWIQAGSFSSLGKATDVKERLSEEGITCTITTTEVNGSSYYRVRLGPYTEKQEAGKFLEWIKAIRGFESSYISEVYVTK